MNDRSFGGPRYGDFGSQPTVSSTNSVQTSDFTQDKVDHVAELCNQLFNDHTKIDISSVLAGVSSVRGEILLSYDGDYSIAFIFYCHRFTVKNFASLEAAEALNRRLIPLYRLSVLANLSKLLMYLDLQGSPGVQRCLDQMRSEFFLNIFPIIGLSCFT